jgi:hypothetical protein
MPCDAMPDRITRPLTSCDPRYRGNCPVCGSFILAFDYGAAGPGLLDFCGHAMQVRRVEGGVEVEYEVPAGAEVHDAA